MPVSVLSKESSGGREDGGAGKGTVHKGSNTPGLTPLLGLLGEQHGVRRDRELYFGGYCGIVAAPP